MKAPIFVRSLTDAERTRLEAGLRSSDAFVLRRCQLLLARARGERPSQIARVVGCSDQTVRNVIHRCAQAGLEAALTRRSNRPHRPKTKLDAAAAEQLRELLPQSPRRFGQPAGIWTLELADEVSFAQGITAERVSDETIRTALKRLRVGWRRAKRWITSPDPEYLRKKAPRPSDALGGGPRGGGPGLPGRDLVEPAGPASAAYLDSARPAGAAGRADVRSRRPTSISWWSGSAPRGESETSSRP